MPEDTPETEGTSGELPKEGETPKETKLYAGAYASVEELEKGTIEKQKLIGKQGEEIGELRKRVAYYESSPPPAPSNPEPDFFEKAGSEIYENPAVVLKEIYRKAKDDAVREGMGMIEIGRQQQETKIRFYHQNPDLKKLRDEIGERDFDRIVASFAQEVISANPTLASESEAFSEVARRVRVYLGKIKELTPKPEKPLTVAGGAGATETKVAKEEKPMTEETAVDSYISSLRKLKGTKG